VHGLGEKGHLVFIILTDVVSLPLGKFFRLEFLAYLHAVLLLEYFGSHDLVSEFQLIKVADGFSEFDCCLPVFSAFRVFGYEPSTCALILDNSQFKFVVICGQTVNIILDESAQCSLHVDALAKSNVFSVVRQRTLGFVLKGLANVFGVLLQQVEVFASFD